MDSGRPFVAVVGGFFALDRDDPDAGVRAREVGRELGRALAEAGFGVVVYFSNPKSLEPYVVEGYVQALDGAPSDKPIRIRCAQAQRVSGGAPPGAEDTVEFAEERTHEGLFDLQVLPGKDWVAPFYRSLADQDGSDEDGVDAVLLVAGGHSTSIAGQVAVGRRLPVLAVNAFEGSAKEIWNELRTRSAEYPDYATTRAAGAVAWLRAQSAAHRALRDHEREKDRVYANLVAQEGKRVWAVGASGVMLAALIAGLASSPAPQWYAGLMLLGLIATGGTGALTGSLLWGSKGTSPATATFLGALAGLLAGLAYVVPQWVGDLDTPGASPEVVSMADRIQFVSAMLVAFTAGIGFDTVFARYKTQAADLSLTPSD